MAYTPTEWTCGDVVTAEKMNKIEQGVKEAVENSGSALLIELDHEDSGVSYFNKTYQEVKDAFDAGSPIFLQRYVEGVGGTVRFYIAGVAAEGFICSFSDAVTSTEFVLSANSPLDLLNDATV